MKLKYLVVVSAILMLMLVGIAVAAPPPPVPQELGKVDTQFPNVTVSMCRGCHGGQPTALTKYPANNIHHYMVGKKTTTLGCDDCHTWETLPDGSWGRYVEPDCKNCHNGTGWYKNPSLNLTVIRGSPGRPHHNTSKNSTTNLAVPAKNMAADRNCRGCHGEAVIDNYDDGHVIKNLSPQLVSVLADYKINSTIGGGTEWGGCAACHDGGSTITIGPDTITLNGNHDTHHYETTSMLGRQCNYCHVSSGYRAEPVPDYSPEPSASPLRVWLNNSNDLYYQYYLDFSWDSSQRHVETSNWTMLGAGDTVNGTGCLKCHSYRDLHSIEGAGPNPSGLYNVQNKIPGLGHVGNDTDCDGCHAGWAPSALIQTGQALSPSLDSVTPGRIVAGTDTEIVLAGQNLNQEPNFTTSVLLDGAALNIVSLADKEVRATVPGTTAVGVHSIVIKVGNSGTAVSELLVAAPVSIASAELSAGQLTITGTNLGDEMGAGAIVIKKADGTSSVADSLVSWNTGTIVATSAAAAAGDTVEVTTTDGTVSATITSQTQPPVLTTIELTGPSSVVRGRTAVYTATAKDQYGAVMSGIVVNFASSNTRTGTVNPAHATTNSNGVATTTLTALRLGTTSISATSGTVSATPITVTVTAR